MLCCKKLASEDLSSWKITLFHYLKPVGGKFILGYNFELKKLPIKLPGFYEECLKDFSQCSAGSSVAECSARRTRNPAVPGLSTALATCWICARSSRVQFLGHTCK